MNSNAIPKQISQISQGNPDCNNYFSAIQTVQNGLTLDVLCW